MALNHVKFIFLFGFLAFLLSFKFCYADQFIDIEQNQSNSEGVYWGQVFQPNYEQLNQIGIKIAVGTSSEDVIFVLCKGDARDYDASDIFTGSYPNYSDLNCASGDTELSKQTFINGLTQGGYGVTDAYYLFYPSGDDYWTVEVSEYYYYLLYEMLNGDTMSTHFYYGGTDQYTEGCMISLCDEGSTYWDGTFLTYTGGDISDCQPYNINDACDDVTPSSDSFWDDFRYGLECGARKLFYWILTPKECSIFETFKTSAEKLEDTFPLNAYFDLADTIDDVSIISTTTDDSLGVPMIRDNGTTTEFYILPLISSSTFQNILGTNYNLYRNSLSYFFWIITGVIVAGISLISIL